MALLALLAAWFGYSVGILTFVGIPWLVSTRWPRSTRATLARLYWGLSQAGFFRILIAAREHASTVMDSASPTKFGSLRISYNGGPQDYEDVANRMRYHRDKPLGFGIDQFSVVVDPLDAAVARRTEEYRAEGVATIEHDEYGQDAGDGRMECLGDHVKLPDHAPLVNLHDAGPAIGGDAAPENTEIHAEEIKKSQDPFTSTDYWDVIQLVVASIAGLVAVYALFVLKSDLDSGGGGGPGTDIVSPMLYVPMDAVYAIAGGLG